MNACFYIFARGNIARHFRKTMLELITFQNREENFFFVWQWGCDFL